MNVIPGFSAASNQRIITKNLKFWLEASFPSSAGSTSVWPSVMTETYFVPSFFNEISIDGSGTTTSDGTYTRQTPYSDFYGPNGNYISFSNKQLYDDSFGDITYATEDFENWYEVNGEPPAPTGTLGYTIANYYIRPVCNFNTTTIYSTVYGGYYNLFNNSSFGRTDIFSDIFSFGTNPKVVLIGLP